MYDLEGLTNQWQASQVGHVPVTPSAKGNPIPVLARLVWPDRALWVPAAATRWNSRFVLVYVWPDETNRSRSERLLWLHHTDISRALPAAAAATARPMRRSRE